MQPPRLSERAGNGGGERPGLAPGEGTENQHDDQAPGHAPARFPVTGRIKTRLLEHQWNLAKHDQHPDRQVLEHPQQEELPKLAQVATGLAEQLAKFRQQLILIQRGCRRGGLLVGVRQEADKLPIAFEGAVRRGFQRGQRGLLCRQAGLELLERGRRGGQARGPVALRLEHPLLEFVFPCARPVLDAPQALLFAGLVSLADPGLPRFVFRPGGFFGRREGRLRLADGGGQLRRLLFLRGCAEPLFPARPGVELRIELLRPGRKLPGPCLSGGPAVPASCRLPGCYSQSFLILVRSLSNCSITVTVRSTLAKSSSM